MSANAPADDDLVMFLGLVGLFAVFGACIDLFRLLRQLTPRVSPHITTTFVPTVTRP